MRRMKVGAIGCGNISPIYLQAGRVFESIKIVACADIDMEKACAHATVEAARARGRRVGSAPDTFLGGGIQTCRKLIDDGWIGEPVGAVAFMTCHGPESWHPSPESYYEAGGGRCSIWGPITSPRC